MSWSAGTSVRTSTFLKAWPAVFTPGGAGCGNLADGPLEGDCGGALACCCISLACATKLTGIQRTAARPRASEIALREILRTACLPAPMSGDHPFEICRESYKRIDDSAAGKVSCGADIFGKYYGSSRKTLCD